MRLAYVHTSITLCPSGQYGVLRHLQVCGESEIRLLTSASSSSFCATVKLARRCSRIVERIRKIMLLDMGQHMITRLPKGFAKRRRNDQKYAQHTMRHAQATHLKFSSSMHSQFSVAMHIQPSRPWPSTCFSSFPRVGPRDAAKYRDAISFPSPLKKRRISPSSLPQKAQTTDNVAARWLHLARPCIQHAQVPHQPHNSRNTTPPFASLGLFGRINELAKSWAVL